MEVADIFGYNYKLDNLGQRFKYRFENLFKNSLKTNNWSKESIDKVLESMKIEDNIKKLHTDGRFTMRFRLIINLLEFMKDWCLKKEANELLTMVNIALKDFDVFFRWFKIPGIRRSDINGRIGANRTSDKYDMIDFLDCCKIWLEIKIGLDSMTIDEEPKEANEDLEFRKSLNR